MSGVHLLPYFPCTSDDGFAVTDYRAVNSNLGDWADIERIAGDFKLLSDLVLNHVSGQGPWFTAYLQGHAPYDRFVRESDPGADLRGVVRTRTHPLLRPVDTAGAPRHAWCTFSHDQVDLDFRNPEVLLEFLRILNGTWRAFSAARRSSWRSSGCPANATQFALQLGSAIFGFWRHSIERDQSIFALHNVSRHGITLPAVSINLIGADDWVDLLSWGTAGRRRRQHHLRPLSVSLDQQPALTIRPPTPSPEPPAAATRGTSSRHRHCSAHRSGHRAR